MLNVLLVNDELTPMDFVVEVLEDLFGKSWDEAIKIMLEAHRSGQAICGTYAEEQARELVRAATLLARDAGHPLRFSLADASSVG